MKTLLLISFVLNLLVAERAWSYEETSQKRYSIRTVSNLLSDIGRYKLYSLANGNRELIGILDPKNLCNYAYGSQFPLEIVLVSYRVLSDIDSEVVKEPSHMELHYLFLPWGEFVIVDREDFDPCPSEENLEIWGNKN